MGIEPHEFFGSLIFETLGRKLADAMVNLHEATCILSGLLDDEDVTKPAIDEMHDFTQRKDLKGAMALLAQRWIIHAGYVGRDLSDQDQAVVDDILQRADEYSDELLKQEDQSK